MSTSSKSWKCSMNESSNTTIGYLGIMAMGIFIFFVVFLLFASYISVIGIENVDLGARLEQYWNPLTNPFVWVLIALFSVSLLLLIIYGGIHKACKK